MAHGGFSAAGKYAIEFSQFKTDRINSGRFFYRLAHLQAIVTRDHAVD